MSVSAAEKVVFGLGVFAFTIFLCARGFDLSFPLDGIVIGGAATLLFLGYQKARGKYWPEKEEIVTAPVAPPDANDPNYVSFWHRETPMVSGKQLESGVYAVTDRGYVQAAVLFSFILPGLGQTYNGQYLKGTVLTVAGLLLVWVIGYWALIIWLVGAADAYVNARRVVAGTLKNPKKGMGIFLHLCLGAYFLLISVVLLTTFIKRG
jgi:TM2 domain-containing membrane protein YozV